jgi:transcriptional antiterminator NusG
MDGEACFISTIFRPAKTYKNNFRIDRKRNVMWLVMQVVSGREGHTVLLMERILSREVLEKCFVPMRRMKKKYQGSWKEITEKLFPGYVFLISEQPQLLYDELKQIPVLTKLLGNCEEYFTPLSEDDVRLLKKLQDLKGEQEGIGNRDWIRCGQQEAPVAGLSKVIVGEEKTIKIISGPLKNLEGRIKKVNLHKRVAVVETEFMGNRSAIHLGIEIVGDNL